MASKKSPAAEPATPSVKAPAASTHNVLISELIPVASIEVHDKHDRTRDAAFTAGIAELAASMAAQGLIQPILVYRSSPGSYIVAAGERRLLAARLNNWAKIPGVILAKEADVDEIRAAENLQRAELNDDQKALVIGDMVAGAEEKVLTEQGVKDASKLDPPARDAVRVQAVKRVAERFGWPVQRVRDFAFIGELPAKTRALGAAGRLSISHLRVLSQVPDSKQCDQLAAEFAGGEDTARHPMGKLDQLRVRVAHECNKLSGVPWSMDVAFAGGPACSKCPDNSRNRTGLFDGAAGLKEHSYSNTMSKEPEAGICLKVSCFRAKNTAAKSAIRGAGDRIATKAKAAKPAERGGTINGLIRAATEKATFITPTVFGREVRERVKNRLDAAKTNRMSTVGVSGGGFKKETPEQQAQKAARAKFESAARGWYSGEFVRLKKALASQPLACVLLTWLTHSEYWDEICYRQHSKKADAARRKLIELVPLCFTGSLTDAITVASTPHADHSDGAMSRYMWGDAEPVLEAALIHAKVPTPKPMPKLEDFLPKPKVEAAAKKPTAKTHAPAKGKAAAKPGKKKTKKISDPKPLHETAKGGVAVGKLKKLTSKDAIFTPSAAETAAAAREAGELEDDDAGEGS